MAACIKVSSAERQSSRHEQVFVGILRLLPFIARVLWVISLSCLSSNHTISAQVPSTSVPSAQVLKDGAGFSTTRYAVYLDNKPASMLTVVELAGRMYVEPLALATALDCELRAEGTLAVLLLPSHVLAFAVDAHVVGVQAANSNAVSLTQMLHPVALQGGRVYLPFDDVLRLLADNGVYDVDERETEVYLHSTGYSPPEQSATAAKEVSSEPVKKESTSEVTNNSAKNDTSTEQKAPATKPFRKPTRNLYILPNDVKRREMDSLPQKSSRLLFRRNKESLVSVPVNRWVSVLLLSRFLTQSVKKKPAASPAPHTNSTEKSKIAGTEKSTSKSAQNTHSDNDFASAKKKWALDVIVLDAGHGGKDAGTIGFGKTKEKDVALGIVKKLGAMLKKELHGTKIVYTRTDDTFVELDRRGQIANENGGKLFISVHCNSTPKKPSKANGFEVYILRPGRNDDAVRVAEMENAVIKLEDNPKRYKPLTDEQFIVVSMAQSAFVKYSDMAAAMISAEVKKLREIGIRGVNQAGFLVLVGASMPNMLIETGFLSNKNDEKFLKSERGQTRMASAICRAIKAYRTRYEAQINNQGTTQRTETDRKSVKSPVTAPKNPQSSTATKKKSPLPTSSKTSHQ